MQTRTFVKTPTIGAVIVNYNYASFLPDAIESVLHQDSPFDDIVVVDDGSSDASLEVIEMYKTRVRVVTKENGGQLSACIAGAAGLMTDYVYFLDSDDYAAPDLVRRIRPALLQMPVKVQFQLHGVNAKKDPLGSVFPTYANQYGEEQMREDNQIVGFYVCPPTSGNLFRRETFNSLKVDLIDRRDFVDGPPALAMPYLGKVVSLNIPFAYYRIHGSGHSRWDQPNPSLLNGEIAWFGRRWQDTCRLLGFAMPPFGNTEPLYVLERKLMLSALEAKGSVLSAVIKYVCRLSAAKSSGKQRWMLTAWAVSLLFPSAVWRRKQIFAKRSPVNRSSILKHLIDLLLRHRRVSASLNT